MVVPSLYRSVTNIPKGAFAAVFALLLRASLAQEVQQPPEPGRTGLTTPPLDEASRGISTAADAAGVATAPLPGPAVSAPANPDGARAGQTSPLPRDEAEHSQAQRNPSAVADETTKPPSEADVLGADGQRLEGTTVAGDEPAKRANPAGLLADRDGGVALPADTSLQGPPTGGEPGVTLPAPPSHDAPPAAQPQASPPAADAPPELLPPVDELSPATEPVPPSANVVVPELVQPPQPIAPVAPAVQQTEPAASPVPTVSPQIAGSALAASAPAAPSTEPAPPPPEPLLQVPVAMDATDENKRWRLRLGFSAGLTYDDNIFITRAKQGDEILSLSGGLAFEAGDYRNLSENYLLGEYRLDGFLFARFSQEDAANQLASLRTQFRFGKLTLRTESRYEYLTGADRQVGNFVSHHYLDNVVRLLYDPNDKTQAFASAQQTANLYQSYLNSYEYVLRGGADYQITPKIKLGGELVLGVLDQEASASAIYGQLRLRAAYEANEKLSLQMSAGGEVRHYRGGGGTAATPVFSLGATWRPLVDTSLGVSAYRNVSASALYANTNYIATGLSLQLSQILFHRVTVGVSLGVESDVYHSTGAGAVPGSGRRDEYFYVEPNLSWPLNQWALVTLSYEFRTNDSNDPSMTFSDDRVTLRLGISF